MAKTQGLERSRTIVSEVKDFNDTIITQILNRPEESFKTVDANNNGVIEISEVMYLLSPSFHYSRDLKKHRMTCSIGKARRTKVDLSWVFSARANSLKLE